MTDLLLGKKDNEGIQHDCISTNTRDMEKRNGDSTRAYPVSFSPPSSLFPFFPFLAQNGFFVPIKWGDSITYGTVNLRRET
jgi:hypothetical protein